MKYTKKREVFDHIDHYFTHFLFDCYFKRFSFCRIKILKPHEFSVEDSTPLHPIQKRRTWITLLDGNIEFQDTPSVAIRTNKIKINLSKNVQMNEDRKSFVAKYTDGCHNGSTDTNATAAAPTKAGGASCDITANTNIEYTVKTSIRHVEFKPQPLVQIGFETSGLCSIM